MINYKILLYSAVLIVSIVIIVMLIRAGGGNTYYVSNYGSDAADGLTPSSAWQTISKVNELLESGDIVKFNRSNIWNNYYDEILKLQDGVTYTDFGTGDKPAFEGGPWLTDDANWTEDTALKLWNTSIAITYEAANLYNASGSCSRNKTNSITTLKYQGDWTYDTTTKQVIINSSTNPHTYYGDIVIATDIMNINMTNADGANVYNITTRYANDGFWGLSFTELEIVDCDVYYEGGAYQSGTLRYGNGITCWLNCHNVLISRNRIYDIYDAAITTQGNDYNGVIANITVSYNKMDKVEQCYEYWNYGNKSYANENITYDHNSCLSTGTGWGTKQRPDPIGRNVRIAALNATLDGYFTNNLFYNYSFNAFRWETNSKTYADNIVTNYNFFFNDTGGATGLYYPNTGNIYRCSNQSNYIADRGQGQNDVFCVNPLLTNFTPAWNSKVCNSSSTGGYVGAEQCEFNCSMTVNYNIKGVNAQCTSFNITGANITLIDSTFFLSNGWTITNGRIILQNSRMW